VRTEPAGPGGLVAVVAPALERLGGTWVYAPSSREEIELARVRRAGAGPVDFQVLDLPPDAHRDHYRTISSELLVPLFHYLLPLADAPAFSDRLWRAWDGYRLVNQLYGAAIRRHGGGDGVLVEDVHLMLAAAAARSEPGRRLDAPLTYFQHIPWCEPDYFGVLPGSIRLEILSGLLAYDCVGFHCRRWADAFAACCERFLAGATRTGDRIEWRGRAAQLVVAPSPLDPARLAERAAAPRTGEWRRRFEEIRGPRRLLVRVERADPSKNAVRGLEAYALLLERRPELVGQVCLLAVLTPVRGWIPEYSRYLERCKAAAAAVNRRFGRPGGRDPVTLHMSTDAYAFDQHRALGALGLADVLVVSSLFDGLNIVAMEGLLTGEPALVLSENAGVHALLGRHALSVNPFDVAQTAAAMEQALDVPAPERIRRVTAGRAAVTAQTPEGWVRARLESCR